MKASTRCPLDGMISARGSNRVEDATKFFHLDLHIMKKIKSRMSSNYSGQQLVLV